MILGGVSSFDVEDETFDNIILKLVNDDEFLAELFYVFTDGKDNYDGFIANLDDSDSEWLMLDYNMTLDDAINKVGRLRNIVEIDTIEFTDEVNVVTLPFDGKGNLFGTSAKTIIVSADTIIENYEINSSKYTFIRRSN